MCKESAASTDSCSFGGVNDRNHLCGQTGNMTSFSAVARARRITGEKKAGHAGTLDPMATGVLPVLFGGATRFMEFLPVQDKGYRAHIRLGLTTDTLDTTGTVLTRSEPHVTREQLEQALCGFRGAILQVPPMYSALSKNGVRLYELARRGEEVERPARPVTVYRLELMAFDEQAQEFEIDVFCSKGTYIRSLADDIGRALGCGAAMSALRRSYAAGFSWRIASRWMRSQHSGRMVRFRNASSRWSGRWEHTRP